MEMMLAKYAAMVFKEVHPDKQIGRKFTGAAAYVSQVVFAKYLIV